MPGSIVLDSRRAEEPLCEIVRGVRVELPPMGMEANAGAGELYFQFRGFLKQHRLGHAAVESMFTLVHDPETKRRPDVAFVSAERWPLDRPWPTGDWDVTPDLAVEVVSPNDSMYAVRLKVQEYFDAGVREVWVIMPPQREALVYTLDRNPRVVTASQTLETPLLPGFSTTPAALFEQPA